MDFNTKTPSYDKNSTLYGTLYIHLSPKQHILIIIIVIIVLNTSIHTQIIHQYQVKMFS